MGALRRYSIPIGVLCLLLCLALPRYIFGLAWVFLIFIVDGYNYWKGCASFMGDLERGAAGQIVVALLAGMICGFLWEFWNYWSITKWIYTVLLFEGRKLIEMPTPGYVGFALFGLETIAFVNLLEGRRFFEKMRWGASGLALIFALASFILIER